MPSAIMPAHSRNIYYCTPPWITEGLGVQFDLDPCSPEGDYPAKPWMQQNYALERGEDGLTLPWRGLVFMNPPWHRGQRYLWLAKLRSHGSGIALIRSGLDGAAYQDNPSDAILHLRGRVQYVDQDGELPPRRRKGSRDGFEPSVLIAYGARAVGILRHANLSGVVCSVH